MSTEHSSAIGGSAMARTTSSTIGRLNEATQNLAENKLFVGGAPPGCDEATLQAVSTLFIQEIHSPIKQHTLICRMLFCRYSPNMERSRKCSS